MWQVALKKIFNCVIKYISQVEKYILKSGWFQTLNGTLELWLIQKEYL